MLLALHKPYDVLSQFTPDHPGQHTLADFGLPKNVYPLGRLDRDSEGLLLLSDEPGLNTKLLDPKNAHSRTYWAQVEGEATEDALQKLRDGVVIEGKMTLPAQAKHIHPNLPLREPSIRFRQNIPTSWIELTLHEGRNRQVRKMTSAAGHPTLRLLRMAIDRFHLPNNLAPGHWCGLTETDRALIFSNLKS